MSDDVDKTFSVICKTHEGVVSIDTFLDYDTAFRFLRDDFKSVFDRVNISEVQTYFMHGYSAMIFWQNGGFCKWSLVVDEV